MSADKMSWWRAHHGLASHARWLEIARKSGQPVPTVMAVAVWLIECASKAAPRGSVAAFRAGSCAAYLWVDEECVSAVLTAMNDVGWIADGALSSWDENQPAREDPTAAERKRLQRERDSAKNKPKTAQSRGGTGNPTKSRDVTHGHAKVTAREEKIEKEDSNLTVGIEPEPEPDERKDLFARAETVLGHGSGGLVGSLLKVKNGSVPLARAAIENAAAFDGPARAYIGRIIHGGAGPPYRQQRPSVGAQAGAELLDEIRSGMFQ